MHKSCGSHSGYWYVCKPVGKYNHKFLHHDGQWYDFCGHYGFWKTLQEAQEAAGIRPEPVWKKIEVDLPYCPKCEEILEEDLDPNTKRQWFCKCGYEY